MDQVFSPGINTTAQRRVAAAVWSPVGATAQNAQATMTVLTTVEISFLKLEEIAQNALVKAGSILQWSYFVANVGWVPWL